MAQSTSDRIAAPWLERFPHGFDDPDLQERLQFVGVSAYVMVVEAPTDLGEGLQQLEVMGHGDRPVVVVTADTRAARWCASFKMGVVDLVRPDQLSESNLKRIFASLADRPGRVSGTGTSRYLDELVEHVRAFRRSGRLEVLDSPGGEHHVAWTWGRVTDLSRVTLDPTGLPVLGAADRWVYTEVEPPAVAERAEELRDAPRLPCDFPAVAVLPTGSRLCRAINFSPGGMLVTAPELRVGTQLRLRVDFGPLGRAELKGVVAHKVDTPRPSVGIDLNGLLAQRQFLERVYRAFEKTLRPAGA
ncbi:MAG: PilZ domain-containing protein [Myxococcaceae bacterium]|nr:PilZ domain-containing protein [Myxococcaceae bacterium]MCA3016208.1 PilZ domain-containing protein [Myxococcaceae bacterium]